MGPRAAPNPGRAGPALIARGGASVRSALCAFLALPLAAALTGCGGGGPLLHPAHVLRPGGVQAGAGLSGQIALRDLPSLSEREGHLQRLSVAPGVAPWVGARVGLPSSNEAGLAYTGRSIRLDARHAFTLGATTLSVGLGASAIVARRVGEATDGSSAYGGGFDIPILLGLASKGDLYAFWIGPRAGLELLSGRLAVGTGTGAAVTEVEATGRHVFAGLVSGIRVGFRHVYVAVEVNAAYHRSDGTFGGKPAGFDQLTITPSGALQISF